MRRLAGLQRFSMRRATELSWVMTGGCSDVVVEHTCHPASPWRPLGGVYRTAARQMRLRHSERWESVLTEDERRRVDEDGAAVMADGGTVPPPLRCWFVDGGPAN